METTKLSSKGQVVLPASIRASKNWEAGVEFTVEPTDDGVFLRTINRKPKTPLSKLIGCIKYTGRPVSIEEMDEAITMEIKARHARGRY